MNSTNLLKLKNDTNCIILNESIISKILDYYNQSNIKTIKNNKKQVNILKNNKIQNKKDLNENKLIMIMNKISHNNINELIKEYLSTISIINEEQYNVIQNEILLKLIKDITFINNYVPFIILLFGIEKIRLSIYPVYFINKINQIILYHYTDKIILNPVTDRDSESDRMSCLMIVKKLIEYNILNKELYQYISNLLLNQNIFKVDIFYWFNDKLDMIDFNKEKINENILYCQKNNMHREQLMIESLFTTSITPPILIESNTSVTSPVPHNIKKKDDKIFTSINNIIEEYLFLEYADEIINFMNLECKDVNSKNIFCKELLKFLIESNKTDLLLDLFNTLIQKKLLFKSNLSKSLLLYLDDNINHNINQNYNIEKFLNFLKNNNITKNIEHVFKKYKIKINYHV